MNLYWDKWRLHAHASCDVFSFLTESYVLTRRWHHRNQWRTVEGLMDWNHRCWSKPEPIKTHDECHVTLQDNFLFLCFTRWRRRSRRTRWGETSWTTSTWSSWTSRDSTSRPSKTSKRWADTEPDKSLIISKKQQWSQCGTLWSPFLITEGGTRRKQLSWLALILLTCFDLVELLIWTQLSLVWPQVIVSWNRSETSSVIILIESADRTLSGGGLYRSKRPD